MTWLASIRDPPQNCRPLLRRAAIQGHSFLSAGQPLTTRAWLMPSILSISSATCPSLLYRMAPYLPTPHWPAGAGAEQESAVVVAGAGVGGGLLLQAHREVGAAN